MKQKMEIARLVAWDVRLEPSFMNDWLEVAGLGLQFSGVPIPALARATLNLTR